MPSAIASRGDPIVTGVAEDLDRAGIDRVGAVDRAQDLGPPGAGQPGDADDLALAHRQVDVLEDAARG